jgi:integrase
MKVIQPIWIGKPETANRVRKRLELVLGWATTSGYRKGDNPARWKAHIENLLPDRKKVAKVEHHAAVKPEAVAEFLAAMRKRENGSVSGMALEFLILTAARTDEVLAAKWTEFDLAAKFWTVPSARMKGAKEHRVPLSKQANQRALQPREALIPFGCSRRAATSSATSGWRGSSSGWGWPGR